MKRAREKVASDGYLFVKGKSRASGSQSDSHDAVKREKTDAIERAKEIKLLQENIDTLESRMQYKKQILHKARSVNNFKMCDDVSGDIINVRKEKRIAEKQLQALQKKESKSQWYHTRKPKKREIKIDEHKTSGETSTGCITDHFAKSSPENQVQATTSGVSGVRQSNSTSSSASDDTLILSSDSGEDAEPVPAKETAATVEKEHFFY